METKATRIRNKKRHIDTGYLQYIKNKKTPVTFALILINTIIWIITAILTAITNGSRNIFVSIYSQETNIKVLINAGGLVRLLVLQGQWWRLITSGFLHLTLVHLSLNMFYLFIFGRLLEKAYNSLKFSIIYFISLLIGSLLGFIFMANNDIAIGASGAILGLFGASCTFYYFRPNTAYASRKTVLLLNAFSIFGQIIFDMIVQHQIIWAHWGGLAGGLICGFLLLPSYKEWREKSQIKN